VRERLQKLLAAAGLASRREAETWIRAGRVHVNGRVARLGEAADPAHDDVRVDGVPLPAPPRRTWLLHKPRGVLTTTRDPRQEGRRNVLELLPAEARAVRLFPVGRLDLDTEGLLILTNDGELAHALLHPSREVEREYRVTVAGRLDDAAAARLAAGPVLDDGPMAPCRVGPRRYEPRSDRTTFPLVLHEGRKRQIRRALRQLGHRVVRLVRTRFGPLRLGALRPGAARPLAARERRALEALARRGGAAPAASAARPRRARRPRAPSRRKRGSR
jgi:23S rRNA pseudouridine2605 synthase